MICMLLSAFVGCEKDEEIEKDPGKIENDGKFNGVTYSDYFYMIDRIVEKDAEFTDEVTLYRCLEYKGAIESKVISGIGAKIIKDFINEGQEKKDKEYLELIWGEISPDAQFKVGPDASSPATKDTRWIEFDGKIYRSHSTWEYVSLVDTYYGEGNLIDLNSFFSIVFEILFDYYDYNAYRAYYANRAIELRHMCILDGDAAVKPIDMYAANDEGYITLSVTGKADKEIDISVRSHKGDTVYTDKKQTLAIKKGETTEITLDFLGVASKSARKKSSYELSVIVDNTRYDFYVYPEYDYYHGEKAPEKEGDTLVIYEDKPFIDFTAEGADSISASVKAYQVNEFGRISDLSCTGLRAKVIIDALAALKPSGKIAEDMNARSEFDSSENADAEAGIGTVWLEADGKKYRIIGDTVCLVEKHYGEGEYLEADEDFFLLVDVVLENTRENTYFGGYRDGQLVIRNVCKKEAEVKVEILDLSIRMGENSSYLTVAVTSEKDGVYDLNFTTGFLGDCVVDDDYRYKETLELKAGKTQVIKLPFGGGYTYEPTGIRYEPMTVRIENVYINLLVYPMYTQAPQE